MRVFLVLMFIGLIICNNFHAQSVDVSAQFRARSNVDNRDFNSDTDFFTFNELRTRVNVGIEASRGISGFFQIQDSRIFGSEPSTLSDTKNLDLHQGFIKVKRVFNLPVDVKLGRMEVKLGNERLVGAVGWSNVGRSFDGSILTLRTNPVDVHLLGFHLNESFKTADSLDAYFGGVWADINTVRKYDISLFILNESVWRTNNCRYTVGTYIKGDLGSFSHEAEFAFQFGDMEAGNATNNISALMFAFNANYVFRSRVKPTISAGIDFLSGDNDTSDDEVKAFNTLYATNHKFYGYMDYFINVPVNSLNLGLMDIHGKFYLFPWKATKLGINAHMFNSVEDYTLVSGSKANDFGLEFDFFGVYKYSENLTLQAGFSIFSPGDIFKEVRGEDTSCWGYGMLIVNL
ncbi:alginate export family protein [Bacteroidota bacterium]